VAEALVIGIGNAVRGDDGAGRLTASLLEDNADVIALGGEAAALLAAFEGRSRVYLIDACVSGAAPGTIRRFEAHAAPLPSLGSDLSTHGFGLASAVELARNLGSLPARTIVYAIEGTAFEIGTGPSAEVAEAAHKVAAEIRAELNPFLS
jgi:hydrogenase maturation protease